MAAESAQSVAGYRTLFGFACRSHTSSTNSSPLMALIPEPQTPQPETAGTEVLFCGLVLRSFLTDFGVALGTGWPIDLNSVGQP